MCGIYGMLSLDGRPLNHRSLAPRCAAAIHHRGPDSHGELDLANVHLATERLRIIDLEHRADQPFADPSGRVWLVCNGEIYNFEALRRRYKEYPFRSRSDVETILPLYLEQGAQGIADLDGMFALAIWDARSDTLILSRDRAGEKPLFLAEAGGELWFASEIAALLVHPDLSRRLDRAALEDVLTLGYVLEPATMFDAVRQVEAGTYVTVAGGRRAAHRYWEPRASAPQRIGPRRAERELATLLESAVERQMVADVPVGVALSGGLDSSLLTALAARRPGRGRLHTFSIAFDRRSYDESDDAQKVARLLRTEHTVVRVDEAGLTDGFHTISTKVADLVADPAILPTHLLARKAREQVTVLLSGEGADELFGGYPTYLGHKLAGWYGALPAGLRRVVRRRVEHMAPSTERVPVEFLLKRFVAGDGMPWGKRHLAWFGTGLPAALKRPFSPAAERLLATHATGTSAVGGAMLLDYSSYLRDDLLVKLDRSGMLTSLETRAPYLDRDLSLFALSLPPSLRVRGVTTKWLLKRVGARLLPRGIVRKRKRGLSVPVASWINGGLREEVDRLMDHTRLRRQGLLPADTVTRLLSEHRSGVANHARALWPLVVLQSWLERRKPEID